MVRDVINFYIYRAADGLLLTAIFDFREGMDREAMQAAKCPQCHCRLAIPKKLPHMGPPICPEHRVALESLGDWDG